MSAVRGLFRTADTMRLLAVKSGCFCRFQQSLREKPGYCIVAQIKRVGDDVVLKQSGAVIIVQTESLTAVLAFLPILLRGYVHRLFEQPIEKRGV